MWLFRQFVEFALIVAAIYYGWRLLMQFTLGVIRVTDFLGLLARTAWVIVQHPRRAWLLLRAQKTRGAAGEGRGLVRHGSD